MFYKGGEINFSFVHIEQLEMVNSSLTACRAQLRLNSELQDCHCGDSQTYLPHNGREEALRTCGESWYSFTNAGSSS
jgi:hypothetical protein